MGVDASDSVDFNSLDIAKNPADAKDADGNALVRPKSNNVYFGVPPKSASSVISLGVVGSDIDRFLSATTYKDTSYQSGFGYFGFDKDSLSVGASRKFANGTVTSLYYNGNIIEDIFAYISNNSLTNGRVGVGTEESADGTGYDFMGDLKDRNNINSRTNVNLMFGMGIFGINLGYSQKLFGLVKKSDATPHPDPSNHNNAIIYNTQDAILDNALVPNIEIGLRNNTSAALFRTTLGFQIDIHQHRELAKGQTISLADFFTLPPPSTLVYQKRDDVTAKLSADYLEPALTLRLEVDFKNDNRSQLGLGLELGGKIRIYSNLDDKGEALNGIFWSEISDTNYSNSITTSSFDFEFLGRPSVRYVTSMTNFFRVGISGGFGIGIKTGSTSTQTYDWPTNIGGKESYMLSSNPYDDANLIQTTTDIPDIDLSLYPNLGVGFSFEIVRNVFALNGGVGATQTLYHVRTGKKSTEIAGTPVDVPVLEQTWGKPLGQLALGATFTFRDHFTLDALFSTNGTNFDNANFVVQLSAKF
ncbi:MAG: aminopeptidase [Spirochaetaceae bacterium]|jgi:hypothetical protein|nr:aminopeptidase [Spirochaetaceae bacterium]